MAIVGVSFALFGCIAVSFCGYSLLRAYFSYRRQKILEFMARKKMYDPVLLEKAMTKFWVWPLERLSNHDA